MPPAVPAAGDAAAAVGPDVLAAALAASAHGVALLDEQGRCVHVNPAGCALLGAPLGRSAGAGRAVRRTRRRRPGTTRPRRLLRWTAPGSLRERELEHQRAGGAHRGRPAAHRRDLPGRDRRPRAAQAVHRVRHRRRERRVRRFPAWHARHDLRRAGGDRRAGRRADLPRRRLRHPDAGPRSRAGGPVAAGLRRCASRRPGTAGRSSARSRRCGPAGRWRPGAGRRRCSPTLDGSRCTTSSTASPGTTSSPCRWWSATARSARSTPTAGPVTSPTTTRSRS